MISLDIGNAGYNGMKDVSYWRVNKGETIKGPSWWWECKGWVNTRGEKKGPGAG